MNKDDCVLFMVKTEQSIGSKGVKLKNVFTPPFNSGHRRKMHDFVYTVSETALIISNVFSNSYSLPHDGR